VGGRIGGDASWACPPPLGRIDRFMHRCGILGGLFLGVFSQDQFLGKLLQLRYANKILNSLIFFN
jgi:hypothetical protein